MRDKVRSIPEYYTQDAVYTTKKFEKIIKETYCKTDFKTLKESILFLESLANSRKNSTISIKIFVTLYYCLSKKLFEKGELDKVRRYNILIKGLPTEIRNNILKKTKFTLYIILTHKYNDIYRVAAEGYIFDKKRRFYLIDKDPEITTIRKEYINRVVTEIVPENTRDSYNINLPIPLIPYRENTIKRETKVVEFEGITDKPKRIILILKRLALILLPKDTVSDLTN